jgi:hypothetical protein
MILRPSEVEAWLSDHTATDTVHEKYSGTLLPTHPQVRACGPYFAMQADRRVPGVLSMR